MPFTQPKKKTPSCGNQLKQEITNKTKNKLRGFSLATEKDISSDIIMLKDILSNMQTEEYKYTSHRRTSYCRLRQFRRHL